MIPFNIPLLTGKEAGIIKKVMQVGKYSGDGTYNQICQQFLETYLHCERAFLTPSGTAALEMAAILCDIREGDEIIMPSYTFPSTANAFVMHGAKIVFTDIRPDTMNIDENLVEAAITEKTKAIVAVHYGGVGCEMDKLKSICEKHKLFLIEDAAHAIGAKYNDRFLGTIGDIGCLSFHESKNIHCGEGGAILLNNKTFTERAEIIREKGTNRSRFKRGEIEKYSWIDKGSSFLLSEISAAYLYAQFPYIEKATAKRRNLCEIYSSELESNCRQGKLTFSKIPSDCFHNGHIFYIKCRDASERDNLTKYLQKSAIHPASHYQPLHSSVAGKQYGRFHGEDNWTTKESHRILRLPMFYKLTKTEVKEICRVIRRFYETKT